MFLYLDKEGLSKDKRYFHDGLIKDRSSSYLTPSGIETTRTQIVLINFHEHVRLYYLELCALCSLGRSSSPPQYPERFFRNDFTLFAYCRCSNNSRWLQSLSLSPLDYSGM